jgi:hypothetical protein
LVLVGGVVATGLVFLGSVGRIARVVTLLCRALPVAAAVPTRPPGGQFVDVLCENALRVTPPGGPLLLAVRAGPDGGIVEMRDGGPGFTDDLVVAFERGALYQRYRGVRRPSAGSGWPAARGWCDGSAARSKPATLPRTEPGSPSPFRTTTLSLPKMSSGQVRRHARTRGDIP